MLRFKRPLSQFEFETPGLESLQPMIRWVEKYFDISAKSERVIETETHTETHFETEISAENDTENYR